MDNVVNKRKQSIGEMLYLTALVFGISGSLLLGTMFSWAPHATYLIRVGIILCIAKSVFIDRYTAKQFWAYIICLGTAILSYDSVRHDMLLVIPFIFAAKGVDFKKIMRTYFIVVSVLFFTVNLMAIRGKLPNLVFFRGGKPRISYGFTYPTLEAAHIFYFILVYMVYKKFKLNWIEDIIVAFSGCFIISKGDARLDGYLTFIILFISIFRKPLFKLLSKLNNFIPVILVVVLIVGYLILAKNYNSMSPAEFQLNNILSNRLALTQEGLMRYPIKLLGSHVQMQGFGGYAGLAMTQISWMARNYFYIDGFFAQTLLINGLIMFIIALLAFSYIIWKSMRNKNYSLVVAIVILVAAGLIEVFTIQISYDILAVMFLSNMDSWLKEGNETQNE